MKKILKYILSGLGILAVLVGAFYWYEWRPSSIRKECYTLSGEKAKDLLKIKSELSGYDKYKKEIEKGLFLKADQDSNYADCLNENGLEK